MADLSSLVSIYNFQGNVEDESGNNLNGTASNITYGTDSWGGKSATFNGSNGNVTVANNSKFDFDENCLDYGIKLMINLVLEKLKRFHINLHNCSPTNRLEDVKYKEEETNVVTLYSEHEQEDVKEWTQTRIDTLAETHREELETELKRRLEKT